MTDSTLRNTYDSIRRQGVPAYTLQGYIAPQFDGTARRLSAHELDARRDRFPYDGIGAAAYALCKAREYQAALKEARAAYDAAGASGDESAKALARAAVAAARSRCYGPAADHGAGTWQGAADHMTPGKGQTFFDHGAGALRNVTDAHDITAARIDHKGWYCDSNWESACVGVVAQLTGRDGKARFVAGYRFTHCDGSASFDMGTIYAADGDDSELAARDAARAADSMAEKAAETEKEYQAAASAGREWGEAGERLAEIRGEVVAILTERRAAMGKLDLRGLNTLCKAIRGQVDALLDERRELRERREQLAQGESESFYFYPDAAARLAFCDGAGLDAEKAPF